MQPAQQHFLLAFWRLCGDNTVEFFVPVDGYLERMRHQILDSPAATARRIARFQFGVEPRDNARIFRQPDVCVVAFSLTEVEITSLVISGVWLPAHLIADLSVVPALQHVADNM